jgi:hypothetical protein
LLWSPRSTCIGSISFSGCGITSGSGNHHFRRLDNRQGIVATAQFQRAHRVGGYHRRQGLIADAQAYLGEQAVDAHFVDEAIQPVARAQAHQRFLAVRRQPAAACLGLLTRQQPIDLGIGDAVMTAFRCEWSAPGLCAPIA